MQYGEEQCRNVESAIATPVALAAKSIATPGPPAPPSSCSPRNVTALEVATLMNARAAAGSDGEAADDDALRPGDRHARRCSRRARP